MHAKPDYNTGSFAKVGSKSTTLSNRLLIGLLLAALGYGPVADLSGLRGHPVRDEAAVKTEHSEVLDRLDRLNDKVDGLSTKVSRMEGYLYDRESKH